VGIVTCVFVEEVSVKVDEISELENTLIEWPAEGEVVVCVILVEDVVSAEVEVSAEVDEIFELENKLALVEKESEPFVPCCVWSKGNIIEKNN